MGCWLFFKPPFTLKITMIQQISNNPHINKTNLTKMRINKSKEVSFQANKQPYTVEHKKIVHNSNNSNNSSDYLNNPKHPFLTINYSIVTNSIYSLPLRECLYLSFELSTFPNSRTIFYTSSGKGRCNTHNVSNMNKFICGKKW